MAFVGRQSTQLVEPPVRSLAVLVAIAASTQSARGKNFIEFVPNIDTGPENSSMSGPK
jgi:hypothetical protein